MSFVESRNLILKTTDISFSNNPTSYFNTTVTSSTGSVAQNRQSTTWTDINLRTLMGNEFYNRFSHFEIKLLQVSIGQTTQGILTDAYYNPTKNVYLSGLSFTSGQSQALLTTIVVNLPTTTAGFGPAVAQSSSTTYMFTKPTSDIVNITIDVLTSNQYYQPATSNLLYGHSDYLFEIYGV